MSSAALVVLLDIGGTTTRFAVANQRGESLESVSTQATPYVYERFLEAMRSARQSLGQTPSAVGVSFGVSLAGGRVLAASKMPDFVGRDIGGDLTRLFGAPAEVHHDCVCVLAGLLTGIQDGESFGYVTVSTGVGAAVVSRVRDTLYFQRIRLAHHVIDRHSTELCVCGRRGCLATMVDSSRFKGLGVPLEHVTDPVFWTDYRNALSVGLGNLCRLFGLSRLFIGGGVISNGYVRSRIVHDVMAEVPTDGYPLPIVEIVADEALAPLRGALAVTRLSGAIYREF